MVVMVPRPYWVVFSVCSSYLVATKVNFVSPGLSLPTFLSTIFWIGSVTV